MFHFLILVLYSHFWSRLVTRTNNFCCKNYFFVRNRQLKFLETGHVTLFLITWLLVMWFMFIHVYISTSKILSSSIFNVVMANLVGVPLIYIFISLGSHPAHLQRLCDLKKSFWIQKIQILECSNILNFLIFLIFGTSEASRKKLIQNK